jgi:hypothetical protein
LRVDEHAQATPEERLIVDERDPDAHAETALAATAEEG